MRIKDVTGHDRVKEILTREVAGGTACRTYLFWGPQGVGKLAMAEGFAAALLCLERGNDACQTCRSCRTASKGEHPDLFRIRPSGPFIKIEALRDLSRELRYRPFSGSMRVALIEEADRMKPEAANAMLKTLEEPPQDTVIILVTSHKETLLDTIRSRCTNIAFGRLTQEEVQRCLVDQNGWDARQALIVSRICDGSLRLALELDMPAYEVDRDSLMQIMAAASTDDLIEQGRNLSEKHRRSSPERIEALLGIYDSLVRDAALILSGACSSHVIHRDLLESLQDLSRFWTLDACHALAADIHRVRLDCSRFANKQLSLLGLFIRTAGLRAHTAQS